MAMVRSSLSSISTGNAATNQTLIVFSDAAYTPTSFAYYDGRIKNGIPSKLQHLDSGKHGNFSVMHIGLLNLGSSERLEAARRTSEGTEAASRVFNQAGYRSLRQLKQDGPAAEAEQQAMSLNNTGKNSARSKSQPGNAFVQRKTSLSPHETKAEQARLLTLLRTLNPVKVVDQLCKGLAYFGGIPGAPPPANGGIFPQSNAANGSGSFFVGWLAEIFPNVDVSTGPHISVPPTSASPPSNLQATATASSSPIPLSPPASALPTTTPTAQTAATESFSTNEVAVLPAKRKRGRPKGSKSSKIRADKGKKHVSKALKYSVPLVIPSIGVDGSTGGGDQLESDTIVATDKTSAPGLPGDSNTHSKAQNNTPVPRKRGRPKGSKNRPKDKANESPPSVAEPRTAQIAQGTPSSGTVNTEHIFSDDNYPASVRFLEDGIGGQPIPPTSRPADVEDNQQITHTIANKSPVQKRKSTQQTRPDIARSTNLAATPSQAPQGTKRRRMSTVIGPNATSGSQSESVSSSFDSQPHTTTSGNEAMRMGAHTPQAPQLGHFYNIATSPQPQQLESPSLNPTMQGQETTRPFRSQHVNTAAMQSYYNQQRLQQASHHMTSISASGGSFSQNLPGGTNARLSQNQTKHAPGHQPAGQQARGRKQDPQSNHSRQPAAQSTTNATMGSYSSFNSQGFM